MAINTTWSVDNMMHNTADGRVTLIYWSLTAKNDGNPAFSAQQGGKLWVTPAPSASDFIAYKDLKESDVLGWVYASLVEDDETANEAKARIDTDRTAKVQGQIDSAGANAKGVPW